MRICVLSQEEAGRLKHYNIFPDCRAHRHISPAEAKQGLADTFYLQPDPRLLTAVMECTTNDREFRPRPSGHFLGPKVMQLVPV
jgi:hypothetical protein